MMKEKCSLYWSGSIRRGLIIISLNLISVLASPSLPLYATIIKNYCVACHQELKPDLIIYTKEWGESVHALINISCEDCHGGDPNSPYKPEIGKDGYLGIPEKTSIPSICERCHSDPRYMRKYNIRVDDENQYQQSIHGRKLVLDRNPDAASCVDCHGNHNIKRVDHPQSKVNHLKVAETCANCHSKTELMEPYGIPADQFVKYKNSVHGQILYQNQKKEENNPRLVPSCPGCHGIHSGKPAGVTTIIDACYNCHLNTKRYFQKSIHSLTLRKNQQPRCIDCHGYHDTQRTTEELFIGQAKSHCGSCHPVESNEYQSGQNIMVLLVQSKDMVKSIRKKIEQIKHDLNIDISELNIKMIDINDDLKDAISATHSQDIKTVAEIVQQIKKHTYTIEQEIDRRCKEIKQRKKWLLQMLIFISLFFSIIAYQRSRLNKSRSKP